MMMFGFLGVVCGVVSWLVKRQLACSSLFIKDASWSETCSSPADVTYLGFETRCDLDDA